MAKMVKHQRTRRQNITPNNDIENQSRIENMCDGEISTKRMCDGKTLAKRMCDRETSATNICDGEISAKRQQDNMAKMTKHQQTK